jgi:hypothetical protein
MRRLMFAMLALALVACAWAGNDRVVIRSDFTSSGVTAGVDEETKGLYTIEEYHSLIHRGKMFEAGTLDTDLDTTETLDLQVTAASGVTVHARIIINTDAIVYLYPLMDAVIGGSGTTLTAYNRQTGSSTALTSKVYLAPVDAQGTTMVIKHIGVGRSQGDVFESVEHQVAPNETFVWRIIPKASNTGLGVTLLMYED